MFCLNRIDFMVLSGQSFGGEGVLAKLIGVLPKAGYKDYSDIIRSGVISPHWLLAHSERYLIFWVIFFLRGVPQHIYF